MQVSIDSLFDSTGTPIYSSSSTTTESESDDNSTLDKTDFLNLLCTQLKYQDPLDPQSNSDMAAQLAQYSSLECMQNIETAIDNQTEVFNSAVSALQYSALSSTNSSSITLIGKSVKIQQTTIDFTGYGTDVPLQINLGNNSSASVSILNADGETVRTLTAAAEDGYTTASLSWDGLDAQGNQCEEGTYTISIEGESDDATLYCYVEGTVSGVRFTDDGPAVVIDGEELSVGDILAVN